MTTKNRFVCADHHIGQESILKFMDDNDNKLRPFSTLTEMHVEIIERHNSVVGVHDVCYFLGDVMFHKKWGHILGMMNGHKRLVHGNHDSLGINFYTQQFEEVYGARYLGEYKAVLTHIPIHPSSIKEGWFNVHGHLHCRSIDDPRYKNVSLEQINYTPVNIQELLLT